MHHRDMLRLLHGSGDWNRGSEKRGTR